MRSAKTLCFAAVMAAVAVWSSALQGSEREVEMRLIHIEARVTDSEGAPVRGLGPSDFVALEDGEPQEILGVRYVSRTAPGDRPSGDQTWIYLAIESDDPAEFVQLVPAIRKFVQEELPPGVRISLAGLPFTDNKRLLLAALVRVLRGAYEAVSESPGVTDEALSEIDDQEFERMVAEELRRQNDGLVPPSGFEWDSQWRGRFEESPILSAKRVDTQLPLSGTLALLRYQSLIERMAGLSGKKAIVLFRPGLGLDRENADHLLRVIASAQRHRISFYASQPEGPGTVTAEEDGRTPMASDAARQNDDAGSDDPLPLDAQEGLSVLAGATGGSALRDPGDRGEILTRVLGDSTEYYLIEYRSQRSETPGRFRSVEVLLERTGLEIVATPGFHDPRPLDWRSNQAAAVALFEGLDLSASEPLLVNGVVKIFADEDGLPVLVCSAGVRPRDLSAQSRDGSVELGLHAVSRLTDHEMLKLPEYEEHSIRHSIPEHQWLEALDDRSLFVTHNLQLPVFPGRYSWKIVMQDQNSGKLGSFEADIIVPDFRQSSIPSSILLTKEVAPLSEIASDRPAHGPEADDIDVLTAGDLSYSPQPTPIFRQGDVIYVLYHLYNPTAQDVDALSVGMQLGLMRGGAPVSNVQAGGQPFHTPDGRALRFAAWVDSATLAPGGYSILAILPDSETRAVPYLQANFTLLP